MNADTYLHRAQVYKYLSAAFLYPHENWLEDLPLIYQRLDDLGLDDLPATPEISGLEALQSSYRRTMGLSGSLPYETEVGMPNEFSQSQELADIAGFYRAFGFQAGGSVRERPDYVAMELEFMSLLSLKAAIAASEGDAEHEEICLQAEVSFLQDHLGRWISPFAEALAIAADKNEVNLSQESPHIALARLAAWFVARHSKEIRANPVVIQLDRRTATPPVPEISCDTCPAAD